MPEGRSESDRRTTHWSVEADWGSGQSFPAEGARLLATGHGGRLDIFVES